MAKTVKMADMPSQIVLQVFKELNKSDITLKPQPGSSEILIITDKEPRQLTYPEGWYYAKGSLRNKHTSSTGAYCEFYMFTSDMTPWDELAKYCTKD